MEKSQLLAVAPTGSLRVLIVEDLDDCAITTAMLLRHAGHQVEIARSGLEALELAAADSPDVVLLDIGLPDMNGYEVAQQLREKLSSRTVLIAISGYGRESDRQQSAEAGIDMHFVKPIPPGLLEKVLGSLQF